MTIDKGAEIHIARCLALIEQQLGWGHSDNWTNYDFSKLSDEVHNRTQVRLSVTTLKRVWGRLKYDSDPTITTLNALAQFAGYVDWREFCKDGIEQPTTNPEVSEALLQGQQPTAKGIQPALSSVSARRKYWPLAAVPVVVVFAFFLLQARDNPKVDPNDFDFKANKVKTEGVPNSVVFHYDATAAKTDSVFIVQTWDISRKKLVSRDNHVHTAMYYYPGFFRTKLIVGTEIVKTHDLWITSDGWLGLVELEPAPLYFKKDEFIFDDRVEVNADLLSQYNVNLHPKPPRTRIFNQRDLGDIMNDNFVFETQVKTGFNEGMGACQFVQVLVQCKDDVMGILLGSRACIGDMELYVCGKFVSAKDADLSGFGADLSEWTKLRVESVNKNVTLFVNDNKAYSLTFPNEPTGVVGVQYRFNGPGAVKETLFEFGGKVVRM